MKFSVLVPDPPVILPVKLALILKMSLPPLPWIRPPAKTPARFRVSPAEPKDILKVVLAVLVIFSGAEPLKYEAVRLPELLTLTVAGRTVPL